ncbi:RNA-directed DNA polymerase from mobile element jockey-like [Brachionus plicatilis]|uniref:RNA-directed DNA polymerase from mobile element jockey-like n=1 Tax=Brachionus plicatilis TaxID=10195 RepID=A0A3M7SGF5_BRAPC|nr:RNA-directed DNA polymerase from mobile element jockey-like [Brachionus plicatilis]
MSYYSESFTIVMSNGLISGIFKTTLGVKQGGPVSPRLFAEYVEDLNQGAKVNHVKIDIILYADDILLISNSVEGLNKMFETTGKFGVKWEININPKKTVYMGFGLVNNPFATIKSTFDGMEVQRVKSAKYLEMLINEKISNSDHVNNRRTITLSAVNKLKRSVISSKLLSPKIKVFCYKTYCSSTLHYGLELIALNKKEMPALQTTESTIVKNLFKLGKRGVKAVNYYMHQT